MDTEPTAAPKAAKAARTPKESDGATALNRIQATDAALLAEGAEIKAEAKSAAKVLVILTTSRLLAAASGKSAPRGSLAAVDPAQASRLAGRGYAREATDREVARWKEAGKAPVVLQAIDQV